VGAVEHRGLRAGGTPPRQFAIHEFLRGHCAGDHTPPGRRTAIAASSSFLLLRPGLQRHGPHWDLPLGSSWGLLTTLHSQLPWIEAIGEWARCRRVCVCGRRPPLMVKAMEPQKGDRWWAPFPKWAFAALGVIANSLLMMRAS